MSERPAEAANPSGVPFVKMHGLGNDFIVIDEEHLKDPDPALVRQWCDRRLGIGADGVLLVRCVDQHADPPRLAMRVINADGSEGGISGNGLRCLGRFAAEHGLVDRASSRLTVEAGGRCVTVWIEPADDSDALRVSVDMGEPAFGPAAVDARVERFHLLDEHTCRLDLDSYAVDAHLVSMGNPHAVIFVDDLDDVDPARVGPQIERHEAFASGMNVQIAHVRNRRRIDMRTWERGAGQTSACGTGACAVAAAAMARGAVEDSVELILPGGPLAVERREAGRLVLRGEATTVFTGRIGR